MPRTPSPTRASSRPLLVPPGPLTTSTSTRLPSRRRGSSPHTPLRRRGAGRWSATPARPGRRPARSVGSTVRDVVDDGVDGQPAGAIAVDQRRDVSQPRERTSATPGSRSSPITWRIDSRLSRPTASARASASSARTGSVADRPAGPADVQHHDGQRVGHDVVDVAGDARPLGAGGVLDAQFVHRLQFGRQGLLAPEHLAGQPRDPETAEEVENPVLVGRSRPGSWPPPMISPAADDERRRR